MDRLLRASAPDGLAGEPDGCVDAEQLAAWADGGLDVSAARIVETHLAACASCQAMAAAFARVAPPAAVPPRRAWAWRWIVPIAATAAAAGLAIWVLAPQSPIEPAASVERTMAQNEIAPVAAPPAAPALEPAAPAASAPPVRSMGKVVAPTATPRDRDASTSTRPPAALRRADEAGRTLRAEPPPPPRPAAAPAPPAPSAALIEAPSALPDAAPPQEKETIDVTAAAPLIQAQSEERSSVVSTTQAESLRVSRGSFAGRQALAAGTSVVAEFAVPNIMMDGVSAIDVGGAMVDTRAVAAATASRWRVLASGEVQRSATSDGPWQAVAIDPAVHITTGAAPLPSVCWLIGRGGVVLRTSDAQHFARVPFPEAVDLVLIRAPNGASATVTAADGRMWTTTDEGKTWR
jgi:hypothetical protein